MGHIVLKEQLGDSTKQPQASEEKTNFRDNCCTSFNLTADKKKANWMANKNEHLTYIFPIMHYGRLSFASIKVTINIQCQF